MICLLDYADFLTEAPCYLAYVWMSGRFCRRYLGASRKNIFLFVALVFCGWLVLNIVNRQYSVPYIFLTALGHLFFTGLILLLFGEGKGKRVLAASMLTAAMTLAGNFSVSLLSCLVLSFQYFAEKIPEPIIHETEAGLIGCVGFFLVILAVYWMSERLTSVFGSRRGKWYLVSAIPLFAVTAVIDVVNWGASNGIMVSSRRNQELYYDQIFSHVEICVLTGLSIFAAAVFLFGMDRLYLEQKKSSRYQSQVAVYKMLTEQYRQSERLRHDMKNHIIALSGLFQNKEWEKLSRYIKNMESVVLETGGDATGSKAVDALLYQKRKQAEQEQILWECDVQIPNGCGIDEFDLCVLFGNILDNALEACKRVQNRERRFVRIQAKTVKKCFFLEVKNSMDPARHGEKKEAPGQGNFREHGIGLFNINDTVRQYNGVTEIEAENGIFSISVLMPMYAAVHDSKRTV
ncbi:MAG: GHKL domain-containing protein [Eubacterium sp.]|nr:GHKL domain-containing protein [Eubacterium sp.]